MAEDQQGLTPSVCRASQENWVFLENMKELKCFLLSRRQTNPLQTVPHLWMFPSSCAGAHKHLGNQGRRITTGSKATCDSSQTIQKNYKSKCKKKVNASFSCGLLSLIPSVSYVILSLQRRPQKEGIRVCSKWYLTVEV